MTARGARFSSRHRANSQGGFTLVELLVAMSLFLILGAVVFSGVMALSRGLTTARATTDMSAEARTALERISRELRQADTGADPLLFDMQDQSLRFAADFDGDGTIHGSLADPEVVTYAYDADTHSISMTATVPGETPVTRPLLAGWVTALEFTYSSSDWSKDQDPPGPAIPDGIVTIDEAGVAGIDRVGIALTVSRDGQSQTFTTEVTMRNRSQT